MTAPASATPEKQRIVKQVLAVLKAAGQSPNPRYREEAAKLQKKIEKLAKAA